MSIARRYVLLPLVALASACGLAAPAADPTAQSDPSNQSDSATNSPSPARDKADSDSPAPSAAPAPANAPPRFTTETLRGKVVWLEDALSRRFGVATEPDAQHTSVVLEMADGRLWPIVPDTRGRAFVVDERLREIEVGMLVRRYDQVPMIQVIRLFRDTPEGRVEIDYWCDICAIPMYILKPCECCQGETRLRERLMTDEAQ